MTAERLEYLRGEIRAERISYSEIAELQSLAPHIDRDDVELLEWAGVPEYPTTEYPTTTWEILWYRGGPDFAPKCIGRDFVAAEEIAEAIAEACRMLASGEGAGEGLARGFYVREKREDDR